MIQAFPEKETIDSDGKIMPITIDGQTHLIFKEHNLKHCYCTDLRGKKQKFWTGDAGTECPRRLDELKEWGKPTSRTYYCPTSGHHITILKHTLSEREAHKKEYLGDLNIFN